MRRGTQLSYPHKNHQTKAAYALPGKDQILQQKCTFVARVWAVWIRKRKGPENPFSQYNNYHVPKSLPLLKLMHHKLELIIKRCIALKLVSIPLQYRTPRVSKLPHLHHAMSHRQRARLRLYHLLCTRATCSSELASFWRENYWLNYDTLVSDSKRSPASVKPEKVADRFMF